MGAFSPKISVALAADPNKFHCCKTIRTFSIIVVSMMEIRLHMSVVGGKGRRFLCLYVRYALER